MATGQTLSELTASQFLGQLETSLAIYADAMQADPSTLPGRRELMRRHAGYPAFRAFQARKLLDGRPASGAAASSQTSSQPSPRTSRTTRTTRPPRPEPVSWTWYAPRAARTPRRPLHGPPQPSPRPPTARSPASPTASTARRASGGTTPSGTRSQGPWALAGPRSGWPTRSRSPRCTSTSSISAAVSAPRCC